MRIVAGIHRGRRLVTPDGDTTRPTTDRVRESIFNVLFSMGGLDGAVAVDLYAGSGALGFEALSRGAARVTFVERDRKAQASIRDNAETLGVGDQVTLLPTAVATALPGLDAGSIDVVFVDPPYAFDEWDELLGAVARVLAPDGLLVVESDREVDLPETLEKRSAKTYGGTVITFAQAASQSQE